MANHHYRFLSVTDKAFPTNVMEEGGGWGGDAQTALLAAPRMVDWQLGTRVGSARQERSEMDVQGDGQVDDELAARHWRSTLAPLEKRPYPSSFPSSLGETAPRYTVKELRFGSDTVKDWGVIPRVAKVLPFGSMVRILRINPTYHWDHLHLLSVMDALLRLEKLYVEPHKFTGRRWQLAPRSHFFTREQENQLTGSVDGLATGTLPPPPRTQGVVLTETRVRVLVVFGAAVTVLAIEAVVRRCPLVEVFKFSQTIDYYRDEGTIEESARCSDLLPHRRGFCKRLREFQYSKLRRTLTAPEIHAAHSVLPRMHVTTREPGDTAPPQPRTGSLPHHHHHPSILCLTSRELSPMQDYIKTFKANWLTGLRFDRIRKATSLPFQNTLHTNLCASPNLVVFTALSVNFYLQDMDVNNLLESDGSYRMKDGEVPKAELTRGAVIGSTAHEEEE